MPKISKIVGVHIREISKKKGLTLEQLADKASLSLTYIGDIERGTKDPSLKSLKKVADALQVNLSYILKPLDKVKKDSTIEIMADKNLKDFLEFLDKRSYEEIEVIKNISKLFLEELKKYKKLKKN